jgi:pyruvate-formate lyase
MMGRMLGATPNGRHAWTPISFGANPDPGFASGGAPTALANAVASVQCGYGNAAPVQMDIDPLLASDEAGQPALEALIRGHFAMGGTLMNINVLNKEKILEAHADPASHPDLIVRVTGFASYFILLSPEFRQLTVDRIISGSLG